MLSHLFPASLGWSQKATPTSFLWVNPHPTPLPIYRQSHTHSLSVYGKSHTYSASTWAEPHRHTPLSLFQTHSHAFRVCRWFRCAEWRSVWSLLRTHTDSIHPWSHVLSVCVMSWGCGLKYLFSLPPALQQAGVCALRAPDDFSRLEMVQRLAKDGYRFLQNQNYRLPDRSAQVGLKTLSSESVGWLNSRSGVRLSGQVWRLSTSSSWRFFKTLLKCTG